MLKKSKSRNQSCQVRGTEQRLSRGEGTRRDEDGRGAKWKLKASKGDDVKIEHQKSAALKRRASVPRAGPLPSSAASGGVGPAALQQRLQWQFGAAREGGSRFSIRWWAQACEIIGCASPFEAAFPPRLDARQVP